jgi:UDPglucose 6-dehydrogenase
MGLDHRIGSKFLHAGPGFGGSCFPKDLAALVQIGLESGEKMELAATAAQVNERQRQRMVEKIRGAMGDLKGKTVALLGLSFKPNTNDLRESPALTIAERLLQEGATVRAYDPEGLEESSRILPQLQPCKDAYDAAQGADALVLLTEWNQFRNLDWNVLKTLLRQPLFVDLRNVYEPERMAALGFRYISVGRPSRNPAS